MTGVDSANTWGRLDILGANGVVKTIYNGPLVAGSNWFPLWNGMDSAGRRMPSASYDWRLTVSKAGESTVVRGKITVSKIHFVIKGGPTDPDGDYYIRYMVPGNANIYVQATTTEPYDMFAFGVGYAPTDQLIYATDVLDVTNANAFKGTFYMRGAEATPYRGNHVVIVAGDIAPSYTMTFIQ